MQASISAIRRRIWERNRLTGCFEEAIGPI
jgi:hypothetical protein